MKLRLVLPSLSIAVPLVAGVVSADDFVELGWSRVFTDEFDGPAVDPAAWDILERQNSFNNEKQYYLPSQVSVVEGAARLTATNEPFGNKQYRSGLIRTHEEWSYGRFEIRADLPTSQGMWPAIWLLPRTVNWPTGGEIDIMENRGSEPFVTSSAYHWQNDPSIPCCDARQFVYDEYSDIEPGVGPVNFHEGYHTYTAEWEPGVVRFYVDGNRHFTIREDNNLTVFDTAKSLILNLAVGGDFGGDPNGTTVWPQHFDIDYVRIWQRENDFTGLVNGGFDENEGSLNDWDTFNVGGGNLFVSDNYSSTGENSLRISAAASGASFAGAYQGVAVQGGERLRARVKSFVPDGQSFDAGSNVQMKVEFYSEFGAGYGSSEFLGEEILTVADDEHQTGAWRLNQFLVDTPIGAVEARYTLMLSKSATSAGVGYFDSPSLVATPNLIGDFNFDGVVDIADYTTWRDNVGSDYNLGADANGDGQVDQIDYDFWQVGMIANQNLAVPEPAALSALLLGALAGSRRRSR